LAFIILFTLLFTGSGYCQDDGPWWKRLFRKETVENQDKQETPDEKPTTDSIPLFDPSDAPEITPKDSIESTPQEIEPGKIHLKTDPRLVALDSSYIDQPPKLIGYRIKIYFGELEQARGIRVNYISSGNKDGCYLKQYPPNFAVMVGNFRSQTEAYQRLNELKKLYPGASIVRDEIELPQVD
ncbi:MAG: hypothetical protein ACPGWM_00145, partial [Flavobacteriales bacterium]